MQCDMLPDGRSVQPSRDPPAVIDAETRACEDTGVYQAADHTLRAFVCPSPVCPTSPRPRTQVDLILPPTVAFTAPGATLLAWPPVLGQRSATWPDIFNVIKQPQYLWDVWKPQQSLDRMSLHSIWACWNVGEQLLDPHGEPAGMKPPLRLVEQRFKSAWRKVPSARKAWQRFREIPEYIESTSQCDGMTPEKVIEQLEEMRAIPGSTTLKGGMSALTKEIASKRKATAGSLESPAESSGSRAIAAADGDVAQSQLELETGGRKRRAPAIGSRARAKKPRIQPTQNM